MTEQFKFDFDDTDKEIKELQQENERLRGIIKALQHLHDIQKALYDMRCGQ